MKNRLCILLTVAVLVSLVGCGTQPAVSDVDSDVSTETTTEAATDATTTTTTTAEETTTTTEEVTTTTAEITTTEATTTTAEETTTTTTEETTTSNLPIRTTVSDPTKGISTTKAPNKSTVTFGTAPTTTGSTEAPTTTTTTTKVLLEAEPVMNVPYVCRIVGGTDYILATVTFTDAGCVIARTFYTCSPENPAYGTDVETVKHGSTTYYYTGHAPQDPARYEIVGITINVFNNDGSIAKTFYMPANNAMECSFSDGVAFGRQQIFKLED
ncbi:MAG: hypothetical protein IJO76_07700 [Clostridia bacterium]|nr:hypothetical protein [Clostridia bacterium]